MKRLFPLSETVIAESERVLRSKGIDPRDPSGRRRLAASIKKLSDFFIENPTGATPWDEDWVQEAYFAYYLPLNEIRTRSVVEEGLRVGFFEGLKHVIDFGAGPGTADFSLEKSVPALEKFLLIERSQVPARLLSHKTWDYRTVLSARDVEIPSATLFVASYSLTEAELPAPALQAEAMMILEPSTQQDGRALLGLRQRLIDEGFHLWAPCLHQEACPLFTQSARDWCHDRVHVDRPEWWIKLEELLPFRNQTITFSYLLARRTPPPRTPENRARLVGDQLPEKGKTRQMICRGPEREFAAWMSRKGHPPDWPRGIVVEIPDDAKKVSNEIRL